MNIGCSPFTICGSIRRVFNPTPNPMRALSRDFSPRKTIPRFVATSFTLGSFLLATHAAFGAFGVSNSGGFYTVDSGAKLVFKINQSTGDMTSCKYNGVEYQNPSHFSHVESGLGSGTSVSVTTSGNNIIITEHSSKWYGSGNIYHYMVVVKGVDTIYMATYVDSNGGGELRWFSDLDYTVTGMPPGMSQRNQTGGTPVNSPDTVVMPDGTTRSKYDCNQMAKELTVLGASGSGIGVYIAYGNRESSSGGPFFRDIQETSDSKVWGGPGFTNFIYNYLFSGHSQTEPQRLNVLYGPYAMIFTPGPVPAAPDMSFMYNFGFHGSVPASARGRVSLNGVSGIKPGYTYYMGFTNAAAQYWSTLNSTGGGGCPNMKPGTYKMTVYKNELAVWTGSVTVTAGAGTSVHTVTANDPSDASAIWRIGDWDGTPLEYKFAVQKFQGFPQIVSFFGPDNRWSWGPTTFAAGSAPSNFPAYEFRDKNSPITVTFNLTAAQVAAHTVNIGITCAQFGARPQISINSWTSAVPSSSTQPNSRNLAVATYRGNNFTFHYSVPASAFNAGANTMKINCVSGDSSTGWGGPVLSFDCVELEN